MYTLNDDATELSGTLIYECDYIYPGIPSPTNPSGNVTFYRVEKSQMTRTIYLPVR